jgi:DNA-binding NarL/FixJ family response regulator
MAELRILLADDHAMVRDGIKAMLASDPVLEIVGEAENGTEALAKIRKLRPDLVIIDVTMPQMNGTEVVNKIKRHQPGMKVIVLTMHKSEAHVRSALDAGADAYLLKEDAQPDLLAAIASVKSGGTYLSPKVCRAVITGYLGQSPVEDSVTSWKGLTDRERLALKLVAEGKKNREIAECMNISIKTVEKHRANVMRKLNLGSVIELAEYAVAHGLVAR